MYSLLTCYIIFLPVYDGDHQAVNNPNIGVEPQNREREGAIPRAIKQVTRTAKVKREPPGIIFQYPIYISAILI